MRSDDCKASDRSYRSFRFRYSGERGWGSRRDLLHLGLGPSHQNDASSNNPQTPQRTPCQACDIQHRKIVDDRSERKRDAIGPVVNRKHKLGVLPLRRLSAGCSRRFRRNLTKSCRTNFGDLPDAAARRHDVRKGLHARFQTGIAAQRLRETPTHVGMLGAYTLPQRRLYADIPV